MANRFLSTLISASLVVGSFIVLSLPATAGQSQCQSYQNSLQDNYTVLAFRLEQNEFLLVLVEKKEKKAYLYVVNSNLKLLLGAVVDLKRSTILKKGILNVEVKNLCVELQNSPQSIIGKFETKQEAQKNSESQE
jgi:hypothetical protein